MPPSAASPQRRSLSPCKNAKTHATGKWPTKTRLPPSQRRRLASRGRARAQLGATLRFDPSHPASFTAQPKAPACVAWESRRGRGERRKSCDRKMGDRKMNRRGQMYGGTSECRVGQAAAKPRRPTGEKNRRRLKPVLQRWAGASKLAGPTLGC